MNRRTFLASVAASMLGSVVALPQSANALIECYTTSTPNIQQCTVGIDARIEHVTAAAVGGQHRTQWCWAACIEMIFRYYGYLIPQEVIVQQVWGDIVDLPAYNWQILQSLNRRWVDSWGNAFAVQADSVPNRPDAAAQDLAQNMPLIICTMGHAMVLTQLQYLRHVSGNGEVSAVIVQDPWPGNGRRVLSAAQWQNRNLLARIRLFPLE